MKLKLLYKSSVYNTIIKELQSDLYNKFIFNVIFLTGGTLEINRQISKLVQLKDVLKCIDFDEPISNYLSDFEDNIIYKDTNVKFIETDKFKLKYSQSNFINGRFGLFIDASNRDNETLQRKVDEVKSLGYNVYLIQNSNYIKQSEKPLGDDWDWSENENGIEIYGNLPEFPPITEEDLKQIKILDFEAKERERYGLIFGSQNIFRINVNNYSNKKQRIKNIYKNLDYIENRIAIRKLHNPRYKLWIDEQILRNNLQLKETPLQ